MYFGTIDLNKKLQDIRAVVEDNHEEDEDEDKGHNRIISVEIWATLVQIPGLYHSSSQCNLVYM